MRKDKVVTEVLGDAAAITPSDLYNAQFKTAAFGGYDKTEVDAYLERVADIFESLVNQVGGLKQRVEEQRSDIERFRALEESLKESLASIQNYKEDILDAARRQAEAIIEEGRAQKAKMEADAKRVPETIEREARALRDLRDSLRNNLRAIIEAHTILLERIPLADEKRLSRHAEESAHAEEENES